MEHGGPFDAIVVGAGVAGCSTALFLARSGLRTAVLDRTGIGTEASGRSAGGIRQQGRVLAELPLAGESIRLWLHFRDELGGRFEYQQNGNLYVAMNPAEVEVLRETAQQQRRLGVNIEFAEGARLHELAPCLSEQVLAGNYCATDGHANPILATRFIARLAREAGATIFTNTEVLGLRVSGGRVKGVETSRGFLTAGAVALTTGPWTPLLTEPLGVRIPVMARRTQVCLTTPVVPLVKQFISGNTVYLNQTAAGNIMIGGGGSWERLGYSTESSDSSLARFARRGAQLVPALAGLRMLRAWGGVLDITPDHTAIIDHLPGVQGVVFGCGFCGHGFAMGPVTGKILAELIVDGRSRLPTDGVRLSRFPPDFDFAANYRAVPEPV